MNHIVDYGLVVFSDYRVFWVIAPGIPLLTECRSEQFYCNRTTLVSRSSFFLQDFEDGQTCGTVDMKFFFGVECTPGEGDVCLLSENGVCRGTGLVTYVQDQRELGVCASSFGFLEAFVACSQHGLPKLKSVSHAPLTHTLPTDVLSVDCNGTENRMSSCFIETMNNTCSDIAYLICESGDFLDTVLVGVSGDPSAPFTVISPADGVYVDDCQPPSEPLYCPGVYYMERTQPSIQNIVTQLQPGQPCCDLGPIHLNIPCLLPTTTATISQIHPITNEPTGTPTLLPTVTVDQANSQKDLALASLGVIVPMLILFIAVVIIVYVGHRRKQRMKVKKVIEELQIIHNTANNNVYARASLVVTRPHRSVDRRRLSSITDSAIQEDLEIPFSCITLEKEIGSGAYGSIYRGMIACEHQIEPVEVAVKVLKQMATASEQRSLQLEIDMMKELGCHRHLITMLACCSKGNHLALVMEYVSGGNLHDFLRSHRQNVTQSSEEEEEESEDEDGDSEDENEMRRGSAYEAAGQASMIRGDKTAPSRGSLTLINQLQLARQITLGMEYLASKNIVHRDLAARNVLVGEDQILKLADFGLSRDIKDKERYCMMSVEDKLPVRWMAVESILDREFTVMSDVWAFGVVLWEIMTYAAFPFYHLTNREVITGVKAGERMEQPEDCPNDVYEIMVKCWNKDPLQRPPIRTVCMMLDELLDTGGYMCLTDTFNGFPVQSSVKNMRGSSKVDSLHSAKSRSSTLPARINHNTRPLDILHLVDEHSQ